MPALVVQSAAQSDQFLHAKAKMHQRETPGLERWFARQYGDARRIEVAAASFSLLPHVLVGTDRIATIQTRLARKYVRTLPLKLIESPVELPKLVETLQWNIHRDPDPAGRWLRGKLQEAPPEGGD